MGCFSSSPKQRLVNLEIGLHNTPWGVWGAWSLILENILDHSTVHGYFGKLNANIVKILTVSSLINKDYLFLSMKFLGKGKTCLWKINICLISILVPKSLLLPAKFYNTMTFTNRCSYWLPLFWREISKSTIGSIKVLSDLITGFTRRLWQLNSQRESCQHNNCSRYQLYH